MPTHNFMLADWAAILAAFGLFSLVSVFPGYALGWLLDVLRFRSRTFSFRLALSVPLSIAIGPIFSYLLGRWLSLDAVWVVYLALSLYAVFLATRERIAIASGHLRVLGLVAIWLLIAVLMLADMQIGRRLYFPIIAFDYTVRSAFTSSIATWGLPAQSPFFFPGHAVALRYHYYWMIPAAMVRRLSGGLVSARQAFIAGTLWCGIGLICLVPLYLRLFSRRAAANLSRRAILGILLLGVTGLDILPALLMLWLHRIGLVNGVSPSVEWWNNQVDGWLYTMLWEPHYIASLIACLTGFLILGDLSGPRRWVVSGITAGLAFGTAAGSGIYVAFVFAIFLILWAGIAIAQKWYRETATLALAGLVAFVASIPYLSGLRSPGTGGSFLQFTVRSFELGELFLKLLRLDRPWQTVVANLVFLPLNYFLELGFFLAVGALVVREFRSQKRSPSRQELAAFAMAGASVVVCTFLKSGVITNNDLGWRGFLIAQFVLLIWAADLLSIPAAIARGDRAALAVLLVLGVAGVVYDLAILRFYPVLSDAQKAPKIFWLAQDEKLGARTYASREAYEWLKAATSARTILQGNPSATYNDTSYGLYADRQMVAEEAGCATAFGGDPRECTPITELLAPAFSERDSVFPDAACRSLPIDILVVKDTDGVWKDRGSWVWSRPTLFANDFLRVFSCSSPPTGAPPRR